MTPIRIRLDLAYDGTHFHGWARQGHSELRTVQQVLEDALTLVLRQPPWTPEALQATPAGSCVD